MLADLSGCFVLCPHGMSAASQWPSVLAVRNLTGCRSAMWRVALTSICTAPSSCPSLQGVEELEHDLVAIGVQVGGQLLGGQASQRVGGGDGQKLIISTDWHMSRRGTGICKVRVAMQLQE